MHEHIFRPCRRRYRLRHLRRRTLVLTDKMSMVILSARYNFRAGAQVTHIRWLRQSSIVSPFSETGGRRWVTMGVHAIMAFVLMQSETHSTRPHTIMVSCRGWSPRVKFFTTIRKQTETPIVMETCSSVRVQARLTHQCRCFVLVR